MELSDFLNIVGIILTIIFGFIITHWNSVKDSQTRSIKNYYIDWIKQIQNEVDQILSQSICKKISSKEVVSWYDYYNCYIDDFDISVRKDLPIRIEKLFNKIDDIYYNLTMTEGFNADYDNSEFTLDTKSHIKIVQMKKDLDLLFSKYIGLINNVPPKSSIKIFWNAFKDDIRYYRTKKNICKSYFHAIINVIFIYINRTILFIGIGYIILKLWCLYETSQQQNIVTINLLEKKIERNNTKIDSLNIVVLKKERSTINQIETNTEYVNRKLDSLSFYVIKNDVVNSKYR